MRIYTLTCFVLWAALFPAPAEADWSGFVSRLTSLWNSMSVAADREVRGPAGESKGESSRSRAPGMCNVPREPVKTVCETASGFLCVNTPPGGVQTDFVIIKGVLDRKASIPANINIAVQNEYTKKLAVVDTSKPVQGGCPTMAGKDSGFCLEDDGRFSAAVPLPEYGPHTISVSATRFTGESVETRVSVSRVVALKFDENKLKLNPDVRQNPEIDGDMVTATIELLGDCKFCDFIGASTGGVLVTVENTIEGDRGRKQRIDCSTSREQGGQGRFVVGVPAGNGKNTLSIRVCNAAFADERSCPAVGGISFTAKDGPAPIEVRSPPPSPTYDSREYKIIPFQFRIQDENRCVDLRFNREAPREVCPADGGVFSADLKPKHGINIATIAREDGPEEFVWTFGWGRVASPFTGDGKIKVSSALEVALPAYTIEKIVIPLINNYLASDEFDWMLGEKTGAGNREAEGMSQSFTDVSMVPMCSAAASGGRVNSLRGKPAVGGVKIERAQFADGGLNFLVTAKDVHAGLDSAPDDNGDGKADGDALPLVLGFRSVSADIKLMSTIGTSGVPLILLTSANDDCSYKDSDECRHMPAPVIPKNFIGSIDSSGGFVECDTSLARGIANTALCELFNTVNAVFGSYDEEILDGINTAIYCSGSALLTKTASDGIDFSDLKLGCQDGEKCDGLFSFLAPVGLPLGISLPKGLNISDAGISAPADLIVGNANLYANTPAGFKLPASGALLSDGASIAGPLSPSSGDSDWAMGVSMDALGAALYAATAQGDGKKTKGLMDIDVDENFFNKLGFDFIAKCDEFVPAPANPANPDTEEDRCNGAEKNAASLPALCFLRPRVGELLGTAPTSYGYFRKFQAKHPLLVAMRGNRALAPRIASVGIADMPVVERAREGNNVPKIETIPAGSLIAIEIGGLELSFYALKVDESKPPDKFGNVRALLDSNGNSVIESMRPSDPDPGNGQIMSIDFSLLIGLEVGPVERDPCDASGSNYSVPVKILTDRSRLVFTPISDTNATTIPPQSFVTTISGKILTGFDGMSGKTFRIPVPKEIVLGNGETDSLMELLGLEKISFGGNGISLSYDSGANAARIATDLIIQQLLHEGGKVVGHTVP